MHAVIPDVRGDLDQTAIDKRGVDGRVRVRPADAGEAGLDGDQVVDTRHHGGADQAVYAYAVEDLRWWAGELGRELTPGTFGENLTTEGLDVSGAAIGERWRVGSSGLLLEVTVPRIPCRTFQGWMDEPHWVKRFTAHGAPGAYLRVVVEGDVGAGDDVEVVSRPDHGVTVRDVFVIRNAPAAGLLRLLEMPGLNHELAAHARRDLAARTR
ncbi:MAG TPA: MOSC domain-containing protein [Actinomycetes bacterium]|nr:MOSC domain-containing protein [Actinomycetes bacterium]